MGYKSGFVALLGKPNVGKSTLVNKLVGRKVAITSAKPQTTRQRMLGVLHGEDYQAVLVDTPGVMAEKNKLHKLMVESASSEVREADLILATFELTHPPKAEDEKVARLLSGLGESQCVFLVLTKRDISKPELDKAYQDLVPQAKETFLVSAKTGEGLKPLIRSLVEQLPEGPPYFPKEQVSEQNDKLWMAEVIREKVMRATRQEIPHSVAVVVEELRPGKGGADSLYGRAVLYVEKESQKGILIGKNGALLKKMGAQVRHELERDWSKSLYLDLWVKVKKDWRERDDWLRYLGYS